VNKLREKKEEGAQEENASGATTRTAARKAGGAAGSARVPRAMIGVLNGSFLTRGKVLGNMPFILFCAGLMITYIAYGYHTERVVRDLHRTDVELKELRSEYITVRARLEKAEQQSQVASGIGQLGLEESRVPPVKLEVEEDRLERTRP